MFNGLEIDLKYNTVAIFVISSDYSEYLAAIKLLKFKALDFIENSIFMNFLKTIKIIHKIFTVSYLMYL
jgi:hypothetical protein